MKHNTIVKGCNAASQIKQAITAVNQDGAHLALRRFYGSFDQTTKAELEQVIKEVLDRRLSSINSEIKSLVNES